MALSPIQLFRSNENSLAQILQGGSQTVSGIMDQAIQLGRDISNKQLSQEKDLSAMRVQQQAFDQRRGETAQQDYEDTRQFARNAFVTDRNYGLQERQEERAGIKDLFNMRSEQERIGLAKEGLGLSQSKFQYEKDEDTRQRSEVASDRERIENLLAPRESPKTLTFELSGPPRPKLPGVQEGAPVTEDMTPAERMHAEGRVNPRYRSESLTQTVTLPPENEKRVDQLFEVVDSPNATPSQSARAKRELASLLGSEKPLTNSEALSKERLELVKEKDLRVVQKDELKTLNGRLEQLTLDPEAFPKWGGGTTEDQSWDDPNQRPSLEALATEDYDSAEAYANAWKGRGSKEKPPAHVAKKRRELWEAVNKLKKLNSPSSLSSSESFNPWDAVP
jgi:hypothetical protein